MRKSSILGVALLAALLVAAFAGAHEVGVKVDGQIAPHEYQFLYHNNELNMDLYWSLDEDEGEIYIGLAAPAHGWVAFGLRAPEEEEAEEEKVMEGVDIVIGYVKDGKLAIEDHYANVPIGHTADTSLGGSDDVLEAAGSEDDWGTVIEFKRKLDTGDRYDVAIPHEKTEVYLAYSVSADDFATYHEKTRAEAEIDFYSGHVSDFEEEEEHEH